MHTVEKEHGRITESTCCDVTFFQALGGDTQTSMGMCIYRYMYMYISVLTVCEDVCSFKGIYMTVLAVPVCMANIHMFMPSLYTESTNSVMYTYIVHCMCGCLVCNHGDALL